MSSPAGKVPRKLKYLQPVEPPWPDRESLTAGKRDIEDEQPVEPPWPERESLAAGEGDIDDEPGPGRDDRDGYGKSE